MTILNTTVTVTVFGETSRSVLHGRKNQAWLPGAKQSSGHPDNLHTSTGRGKIIDGKWVFGGPEKGAGWNLSGGLKMAYSILSTEFNDLIRIGHSVFSFSYKNDDTIVEVKII